MLLKGEQIAMSHTFAKLLFAIISCALVTDIEGKACPARASPRPGITIGSPGPWDVSSSQLYSNISSAFSSDCCESSNARIANWTVSTTSSRNWVGQISAMCTDGTILAPITLGFNGTSQCDYQLSNASVITDTGNYTYSDGLAIFQLLGKGSVISLDVPAFQCLPGMVPIGFGARSACYSISDFKAKNVTFALSMLLGVAYSQDINPCANITNAQVIPDYQLGTTEAWVSVYNATVPRSIFNPIYSSAAGPVRSDCCNTGKIVNWTVANVYVGGTLGQISATCSDGNQLAPLTYGYNGTDGTPDCLSRSLGGLAYEALIVNDNAFNFSSDRTINSFMWSPNDIQTVNDSACPSGTEAIGYSAASACTSLTDLKIYCGVSVAAPDVAPLAPAPAPSIGVGSISTQSGSSGGLSGGGIAGIAVAGIVGAILLAALLAFFLRRRRNQWGHSGKSDNLPSFRDHGWTGTSSGDDSDQANKWMPWDADSAAMGLSSIPYSEVGRSANVVDINDLDLPNMNPGNLDSLPSNWQIPLSSVSLLCYNSRPIELGAGGFGVVYRAIVRKEEAAIKIVKGGGAKEHARLLHEITILESCKSAHIVQFFGYSISSDGLLLCMEFMAGGTLYKALQTSNEFQWYNRGKQAMRAVSAGIFCLHQLNTVHMDLKSLNILITSDRKAKIADLGLGKMVNGAETVATQMGTLAWTAPESLLEGRCSLASDIWSFGVILYEVVTMKKPTRALNLGEIDVPAQAPSELVDLIEACRQNNPLERPTISEVCDWLDRL